MRGLISIKMERKGGRKGKGKTLDELQEILSVRQNSDRYAISFLKYESVHILTNIQNCNTDFGLLRQLQMYICSCMNIVGCTALLE